MLTQAELDSMRTTSTSALPPTCVITRPASTPSVLNPLTGLYDPLPAETVWTGACRVRTLSTQDINIEHGDLRETLGRYQGTIPWDASGVAVDDFLTVTAGTDAELIGRSLRITDVRWSEWSVDRRLVLEDRQQT
jgi:hypothetical protein